MWLDLSPESVFLKEQTVVAVVMREVPPSTTPCAIGFWTKHLGIIDDVPSNKMNLLPGCLDWLPALRTGLGFLCPAVNACQTECVSMMIGEDYPQPRAHGYRKTSVQMEHLRCWLSISGFDQILLNSYADFI